MNLFTNYKRHLVAGVFAMSASVVSAATLTFGPDDWVYNNPEPENQPAYVVEVDDNTAGLWTFSLSIDPTSASVGSFLAFGFQTSFATLAETDFAFVSSNTGENITDICLALGGSINGCGGPTNWNGTAASFEAVLKLGDQGAGGGTGLLTDFVFSVATSEALTGTSVSNVGFRTQTLGAAPDGGGGSAKDYTATAGTFCADTDPTCGGGGVTPPSPVPLPAGLPLLLGALGMMGLVRRKTNKAA